MAVTDRLLCTVYLSVSGTPTFREGGSSWNDTDETLQGNHGTRRQQGDYIQIIYKKTVGILQEPKDGKQSRRDLRTGSAHNKDTLTQEKKGNDEGIKGAITRSLSEMYRATARLKHRRT